MWNTVIEETLEESIDEQHLRKVYPVSNFVTYNK